MWNPTARKFTVPMPVTAPDGGGALSPVAGSVVDAEAAPFGGAASTKAEGINPPMVAASPALRALRFTLARQFKIAALAVLIIASIELACDSESPPTQAICIEHAGDSDKPIIGLAIGTSDVGVQLCRKDSEERVRLPIVSEHVIDSKLVLR
jgi:hypothetical protein